MKLISVEKSTRPEKKLMAVFEQDNGRTKTTHFGDSSYTDYLKSKDPERRARYLERHGRGRENWDDPTSAGSLSKHLLWGSTTVLAQNIRAFKSKFSL